MFNRLVISGAKGIKTHKPWTVALSAMVQAVIVFVLILVPLLYTEALDPRLAAMSLVAPPAPPQPPSLPLWSFELGNTLASRWGTPTGTTGGAQAETESDRPRR